MTVAALRKLFSPALAPQDFLILLSHATGQEQAFLLAHPEYTLDEEGEATVRVLFERRLRHEPIAYILGRKEFYGRDFFVTPATLIPRPETELLVELALSKAASSIHDQGSRKKNFIVDVGTGSGNIAISIAGELKSSAKFPLLSSLFSFHAIDISSAALAVARQNAQQHGVDDIISFHEGNLIEPMIDKLADADEVIITANLPYLSETVYAATSDDIKMFEPTSALVSDHAGLGHSYHLLRQAGNLPRPALLLFEISPEQSASFRHYAALLFPNAPTRVHYDLSGTTRVFEIRLTS